MVQAIKFVDDVKGPIVCSHCGVCARYCPHDCLSVQEI